ncbi:hypothetical protein Hanom_Chr10g00946761 [Helianthus anomalus]
MGGDFNQSGAAQPSNLTQSSHRRSNIAPSNLPPAAIYPPLTRVYHPPAQRPRRPLRLNPYLANPPPTSIYPHRPSNSPPPEEFDDPNPLTYEELNWVYDYTMAQLQFDSLRLRGFQTNFNTNLPPTNLRPTQVIPSWSEGYDTKTGVEYLSPMHDVG